LRWPQKDSTDPVSNCNVYSFDYSSQAATHIGDLLDPESLQGRAHNLSHLLAHNIPKYAKGIKLILVGYGYGGLICEQVSYSDFVRANLGPPLLSYCQTEYEMFELLRVVLQTALVWKQRYADKYSICGIVLVGTPHFRAGLAQWGIISANKSKNKEKNSKISATAEMQDWKDYADNITALTKRQDDFCAEFGGRRPAIKVACCFADVSESSGISSQVSAVVSV